ncbi:DnaJ domain-containing protein [bacterium]|nr:DnaJ domain-containing protein [bacterium]
MLNYYDKLRVSSNFTKKELKLAFFERINEFPPSKSPMEFKEIREAYETLNNENSRINYDNTLKCSIDIAVILREAEKVDSPIDKEKYFGAAHKYDSHNEALLEKYGYSLFNSEKYKMAVSQFKKLIEMNPKNENYYRFLAASLLQVNETDSRIEPLCRKAIKINQHYPGSYLTLSIYYNSMECKEKAIAILDQGIADDEKIDFDDLVYLFEKFWLFMLWNQPRNVMQVVSQIREIIDREQDPVARYAQTEFAAFGLMEFMSLFPENTDYEIVLMGMRAIQSIKPREEISGIIERLTVQKRAIQQVERLSNDEKFKSIFIKICAISVVVKNTYYGGAGACSDIDSQAEQAIINDQSTTTEMLDDLDHIRSHYYSIYKLHPEHFEGIGSKLKHGSSVNSKSSPGPDSCYIATAIYGSCEATQVVALKRFRDEILATTNLGRVFIKCYYWLGPKLAKFTVTHSVISRIVKRILNTIVSYCK